MAGLFGAACKTVNCAFIKAFLGQIGSISFEL